MNRTKIEWADATWNLVTGCSPVSEGCEHCYARRMAYRLRGRYGYPKDEPFRPTLHPACLNQPDRWRKPRRIFVCSMGDLFHQDAPPDALPWVLGVAAAACERHTFMLLTKRPAIARQRLEDWYGHVWQMTSPLPNVWLGVTAENQSRAEERIPILVSIPAAVRFLSIEPMLGPMTLGRIETSPQHGCGWANPLEGIHPSIVPAVDGLRAGQIHWVIVGGETGPGARPMHPDWVRSVRNECAAAGVPFFFKGWGNWVSRDQAPGRPFVFTHWGCLSRSGDWHPLTTTWNGRQYDAEDDYEVSMLRVGKRAAGRLLDGREHNEVPNRETRDA